MSPACSGCIRHDNVLSLQCSEANTSHHHIAPQTCNYHPCLPLMVSQKHARQTLSYSLVPLSCSTLQGPVNGACLTVASPVTCSFWAARGRGVQQPIGRACSFSFAWAGVQGPGEGHVWGWGGGCQGSEAACPGLCCAGPTPHAPLC